LNYLRAAQGIIRLKKTYGAKRLEAACVRAVVYSCKNYKDVKQILAKGLEYETLPEEYVFDELAEVYSGNSIFCRKLTDETH